MSKIERKIAVGLAAGFIAVAAATEGATGELWFYAPIPIFAVGCTVATMSIR